jgi:hypothetical protein
MKILVKLIFVTAIVLFTNNIIIAQDIIVLRNGDELKAKVLEIRQTDISYKNWTNIDGPTYTKNKAEIFMIKYSNGSKDVFEQEKSFSNNYSNNADKFIGLWRHKNYNGKSNQSVMLVTRVEDNYIVEARMRVFQEKAFGTNYFQNAGSFKESGRLENGNIIINSDTKLTLINDTILILKDAEYYKLRSVGDSNEELKIPGLIDIDEPNYIGEYKNGLRHGKGKIIYPGGNYFEGTFVNGEMRGIGTNTKFFRMLGEDRKLSTKAFWINNKANLDSLIMMSYEDKLHEIGYFIYLEHSEEVELYNGLRVTDKKRKTFNVEVVVNGEVRKVLRNLSYDNPINEENWLKFYKVD